MQWASASYLKGINCFACIARGMWQSTCTEGVNKLKSKQQITLSRRFQVVLKALAACFVDIQYTQADAMEYKPVAHTKRTEELINM